MQFMNNALGNDVEHKKDKDVKVRAAKVLQGTPDTYGGKRGTPERFP